MQQIAVLPMTTAAFKTLSIRSLQDHNPHGMFLQAPHLAHAVPTSQQHLKHPWHLPALLNGSIVSTQFAAAGGMAALRSDWPLLPADDSAGAASGAKIALLHTPQMPHLPQTPLPTCCCCWAAAAPAAALSAATEQQQKTTSVMQAPCPPCTALH